MVFLIVKDYPMKGQDPMTENRTPRRGRPIKSTSAPVVEESEKVPELAETEDQKKIRELQEKLDLLLKDAEVEDSKKENLEEEIIIHFVEDGFTAFGEVWNKGQEIHLAKDGSKYQETVDINGDSWLNLTEEEQFKKYKRVYFRSGPATFAVFTDVEITDQPSTDPKRVPAIVRFVD